MHKHLKPLDAIRDEMGWWMNYTVENMDVVAKLCEQVGLTYSIRSDLPAKDLETYGRLNRLEYYQEQAAKTKQEFDRLKSMHGLEDVDINAPLADLEKNTKNKEILGLHKEHQERQKSIMRIQKQELVANLQANDKKAKVNIQFLSEKPKNFLLDEAPEMPRLLSVIDGASVRAFIPRGIVGMLAGAGGVGKTHFLTQLAISVASGDMFLGKYLIQKIGHAFLALGENTEDDIHRLLRKTYKKMYPTAELQASKSDLCQRLATMSVMGMDASLIDDRNKPTEFYGELLSELKGKEPDAGWDLIILDPISRFLGPRAETDNAAATQTMALLERMCIELKGKPLVLFGHHMNKSGVGGSVTDQTSARGSSAITDAVRWHANLEKIPVESTASQPTKEYVPNKIKFRVVMSNHTAIPPAETLTRDDFGNLTIEVPPTMVKITR